MDDLKNLEYQRAFLKLKHAYIRRLENTVRIIDNILDLEQYVMPARADMLRAQALVHGLAGSGTTFGYPQITEAGREADHLLSDILRQVDQGRAIGKNDEEVLEKVLKHVQKVCQSICRDARVENPELANMNIYMKPGTKDHAHILIVEDDIDVASVIAQGLEARGMSVQMAPSGEDALHYLARVQPDLAIVDKELKEMDGIELLQQIKQNSEFLDIPVLILATRASERDEALALRAGAISYIRKPVDVQALCGRVSQIVSEKNDQIQSI